MARGKLKVKVSYFKFLFEQYINSGIIWSNYPDLKSSSKSPEKFRFLKDFSLITHFMKDCNTVEPGKLTTRVT